ncbi:hypothetical protein TRFO_27597 [Tritrichomonas foetus]|uniref:Uncharacterized protein n=1 Tax=Tritrichomonas foetus TaxID=1144522 RepID=A0A1J4K070_9EUKA|nr:hypothetical protein TRFO_27597 [Tritrichomonas foetus]|eukprot:OHT04817.1 hypothetical protein TRFO_27597 [Tritrichomonas foetus]
MEDLLWESRILEEKAQEREEWKMMTEVQLKYQISRIKQTLHRQNLANNQLKKHIVELDQQIQELTTIADA